MSGGTLDQYERDIRECERRIAALEKRAGELTRYVWWLTDLGRVVSECLNRIEAIEKIDEDTMRLVSMYLGYSEGE